MPNWVLNKLSVDNEDDYEKIIDKLTTDNEVDFNNIIPMPDYIYKGNLGPEERRLYGENNWYDWSINNWGVKWNASNTYVLNDGIYFDTPWSGVPELMHELSQMFPNSTIEYKFASEDMFMNTGKFIFNGENIQGGYHNWNYGSYKLYNDLWGKDPYYDYRVYVTRDRLNIVRVDIVRKLLCPVRRL